VDEPKGTYWGGTVAAPIFKRIAQDSLSYLKITRSYGPAKTRLMLATKKMKSVTDARSQSFWKRIMATHG